MVKIRYFKVSELILFYLGYFLNGILKLLRYRTKYLPIKNDIGELLKTNFKIERTSNYILAKRSEGNFHGEFLLRINTSDFPVFKQVIVKEEYFPIIEVVKSKGLGDSIKFIVDAGSNIGLTSIFFLKYFPQAKLVSLEIEESNFEIQKINIEKNGLSENVELLKKAFWNNNYDRLIINRNFRDGKHWAGNVQLSKTSEENPIETITIEDILTNYTKNKVIDILKIDIEGGEVGLFNTSSFVEILSKNVRFLCIEIHDEFDIRSLIIKVLIENNFDIFDRGETTFCINNNLLNANI